MKLWAEDEICVETNTLVEIEIGDQMAAIDHEKLLVCIDSNMPNLKDLDAMHGVSMTMSIPSNAKISKRVLPPSHDPTSA